MKLVELDREEDGRWIGEIPALPGVLAYGVSPEDAQRKAVALAFHVIADMIEHGEHVPASAKDLFALT